MCWGLKEEIFRKEKGEPAHHKETKDTWGEMKEMRKVQFGFADGSF